MTVVVIFRWVTMVMFFWWVGVVVGVTVTFFLKSVFLFMLKVMKRIRSFANIPPPPWLWLCPCPVTEEFRVVKKKKKVVKKCAVGWSDYFPITPKYKCSKSIQKYTNSGNCDESKSIFRFARLDEFGNSLQEDVNCRFFYFFVGVWCFRRFECYSKVK